MDRFKKIDWHPSLEDMIDTVFIRNERMKRESAMYRIMAGNFTDPFEGIEEEYEKVDIELIKRLGGVELEKTIRKLQEESSDESSSSPENVIKEHPPKEDLPKEGPSKKKRSSSKEDISEEEESSYIPGIRKQPFKFPRRSSLSKNQHVMCLRVLLQFSSNEKKIITEEDKIELQNYMSLQNTISEEQAEFLGFAKKKWDKTAQLFIKCPGFISHKWEIKMQRLQKLPKYYAECTTIPFSSTKDVKLEFVHCLQQELLSEIKLPQLHKPKHLNVTTGILCDRFTQSKKSMPHKNVHSVSPSKDTYCESFAINTDANLVISSSGLKCLLNNVDPTQLNSWLIPVVIKSHNGKNVIYVDKKLPPPIATVPQKNTWTYKYILRYCFVNARDQSKHKTKAKRHKLDKSHSAGPSDSGCAKFDEDFRIMKELLQRRQNNKSNKISPAHLEECSDSNDDLEIAGKAESEKAAVASYNSDNNSDSGSGGLVVIDESVDRMSISSAETELTYTDDDITDTNPETGKKQNVSYRLFTINAQSQDYHERTDMKQYRILVRSKLDGFVTLPDGGSAPLMLSPKMEHQLGFGAEAISLEEGLHEWVSLIFRPEASLARVRIEADSSEVIQIERHTATSLNNEIRRLHNVKTEDSLKVLYNVIERLSVLVPGRYIIRHVSAHGPFAYVYKITNELKKNTLNLDTIYEYKHFESEHVTPWPPIDKVLTTPWMRHCKKMPAMFNPYYNQSSKSTEKNQEPKQATRSPEQKGKRHLEQIMLIDHKNNIDL